MSTEYTSMTTETLSTDEDHVMGEGFRKTSLGDLEF